ncbi:MAG: hypothetical protein GWP05_01415 [Anaerolineaceae bacterium]|nr:hypothetical protein [Anaerolineaceae bacterium]
MAKRIMIWSCVALYLLTFLAGTILLFMTEGSFPIASRYFWAYTGLPALALLVHLVAAAVLLWKWERGAPAAIAVETFWVAAALLGLIFFTATFRWIALVVLLRASFGGVILYYLWGPFSRDRALVVAGAAVGLLLGILWPIALQAPSDGAVPIISSDNKALIVWPSSGAKSYTGKQVLKFYDGQASVQDSPPAIDLEMGKSLMRILPMFAFPSVSVDGAWSTTLNTIGLKFRRPSSSSTWQDDRYRYVHLHYQVMERVASRLVRSLAYEKFRDGVITGDLYLRIDRQGEGIDLVALTHCGREIYAYRTMLFTMIFQPYEGQKILLPPVAKALSWPSDLSGDVPRQLLNLQPDRAVLYKADRGNQGPFTELGRAERFADHMVVQSFAPGRSLLVYFPDWQGQALRRLSPAAGAPLCANELFFDLDALEPAETRATSRLKYLTIGATIAGADSGAGRPVVRIKKGTYVNRMSIRLVPDGSDTDQVIGAIDLWQPPSRQ